MHCSCSSVVADRRPVRISALTPSRMVSFLRQTPQQYIYETMPATLQMPIHHSPFTVEATELKGKVKIFALLGCHAALIGSYRRFGTTYQYPLQGTSWPLKKTLVVPKCR